MNVCIIGGSGFIGTELIEVLKNEHNVINIDKSPSATHNNLSFIADVRDIESMKPKLQGIDLVVLLAAEHRDDVTPTSLYYDVNVAGTKNVLDAMDATGVRKIIFTSTVAVYGLNKVNPNEEHSADPFNHYGKSKFEAEEVLRKWESSGSGRSLTIIRPTVVFGEKNRGNVYNLLKQIKSGRFMMIGKGNNKKSMAYVKNIVLFIKHIINSDLGGYQLFNYSDKPDVTTSELVGIIYRKIGVDNKPKTIPYIIGYAGGLAFDVLSKLSGKKFSISSVRVKKFCATTQFDADRVRQSGFNPKYTLEEGINRTIDSIAS